MVENTGLFLRSQAMLSQPSLAIDELYILSKEANISRKVTCSLRVFL